MARTVIPFWLAASMCCLTACSPSQQERANIAADRAAVSARNAMRGLIYQEVEGSVDCAEDCSGHNAGFAYAQEHNIEDGGGCNNASASFVEGCEAYREQIDQCVNAAREAVTQGRQPADHCPLLHQGPVPRATVQQTDR
jgi:hypothetical protein